MPKSISPGFVKICGVTTVDDAKYVVSAGASALGLILAESSRRVSLEQAREVANATEGDLLRFAVFRHNDDDFILEHVDALNVDVVQVHGELSNVLLNALRERPVLVVKALSVDEPSFLDFDETTVDAVLVDSPRPGSGESYSWKLLNEREFRVPVIAAGGMNPLNVADVVASTTVSGVDSSSGVERRPREKDHELVDRFIANARGAFASREST
ncbi:MAG: phosphoribosylanthranilate isomerase [Acidimicrobiales bacterium]